MARIIVIGDVHGCVDELQHLLFKDLRVDKTDRVVFVGDLIDRGPDPAGVVSLVFELENSVCIMGNHEEKAIRWRRHELKRDTNPNYRNPMKFIAEKRLEQWKSIPQKHWDWIAGLPNYVHLSADWTAVHAGCLPDIAIEEQDPNILMRIRYARAVRVSPFDKCFTYKMAPLNEKGEVDGSVVHWSKLWAGPRNIVYGHYTYPKPEWTINNFCGLFGSKPSDVNTLGIDTGCVYGGLLTAFVLHDPPQKVSDNLTKELEVVSIQAFKTYSENKVWNEIED